MNWDRIEGNWKVFKGQVQQQWGKFTSDDLDVIAGNREELIGVRSVLNSGNRFSLTVLAFFHQLFHAFRIVVASSGESLCIAGLSSRFCAQATAATGSDWINDFFMPACGFPGDRFLF